MATVAQIQANRLNAQKSTGPRTAAGKERASRNAIRHGLLAREAVIQGEDPEEFELYREGMLQELVPAGAVEAMLAERVVGLSWRLRRAERLQTAAFAALEEGEPTDLLEARHEEWKQLKGSEWERGLAGVIEENVLGQVVVEDFGGARVLDRLLMYERRIESSLYRTMAQLRREREARATAAEPEGVPHAEGNLAAGEGSAAPAELGSFGANPVAEEAASGGGVSREKYQVSSGGGCDARFVPRLRQGVSSSGCVGRAPAPPARSAAARPATLAATDTSLATATANPPAAGNHGRDARATGTPGGVATSNEGRATPSPAETLHDRSCGTNPISEGGPAGLG
jgi:hypothetical protein